MFRGTWNANWLRNTKAYIRAVVKRLIRTENGSIETTDNGSPIEYEE